MNSLSPLLSTFLPIPTLVPTNPSLVARLQRIAQFGAPAGKNVYKQRPAGKMGLQGSPQGKNLISKN